MASPKSAIFFVLLFLALSNTQATQKLIDEAIVSFLAESGSAFRVVDLKSFKDMFKIL